MKKYFNFNNEADLTEVEVNDTTGVVTFQIGDETAEFETLQEFAEFYATARNVQPENLKNWVMTEDGNQFAFVLRAGTAGVDVAGLAAGLRVAGFTPEEIGRAVAAAQAEESRSTETRHAEETQRTLNDELTELVSNMSDVDKKVLASYYGVDADELIETVIGDVTSDDDMLSYEDDEYEDEELHGVDTVEAYLRDYIREESDVIREEYPDTVFEIAVDLYVDDVTGTDSATSKFEKALFAAKLAHREGKFEVGIMDYDGETEFAMVDTDEAQDAIADGVAYFINNKFYFVV